MCPPEPSLIQCCAPESTSTRHRASAVAHRAHAPMNSPCGYRLKDACSRCTLHAYPHRRLITGDEASTRQIGHGPETWFHVHDALAIRAIRYAGDRLLHGFVIQYMAKGSIIACQIYSIAIAHVTCSCLLRQRIIIACLRSPDSSLATATTCNLCRIVASTIQYTAYYRLHFGRAGTSVANASASTRSI